jgi:hypothetical protein
MIWCILRCEGAELLLDVCVNVCVSVCMRLQFLKGECMYEMLMHFV